MNTTPFRERQVSRKLWIRELLEGEIIQKDQLSVLKTARGEVSRVNVIGAVIGKDELPVSSLTIDDGSGQVVVRSFDQKLSQNIGSVVQVIGRARVHQGTLYVAAEAVSVVAPGWLAFRKKELGEVVQTVAQVIVNNAQTTRAGSDENRAETIIRLIKENDGGDGAPIEIVALKSGIPDAEDIIEKLLLTGDIFELRPGKVKVL